MRHLIAVAALALLAAAPAHAGDGDRPPEAITVTGTGEASVTPDIARFMLGSQGRHPDWRAANDSARTLASGVREAVRSAGVPDADVRTVRVGVTPVTEYPDGAAPRISGYVSEIAIEVTLRDMNAAGPVIDAAVGAGATSVDGPVTEASGAGEARNEAAADAMRDARARAEAIAGAGGFSVGRVMLVSEQGGGPVMPMMMMASRAELSSSAPATTIDPGTERVGSALTVTFAIGDAPPPDAPVTGPADRPGQGHPPAGH